MTEESESPQVKQDRLKNESTFIRKGGKAAALLAKTISPSFLVGKSHPEHGSGYERLRNASEKAEVVALISMFANPAAGFTGYCATKFASLDLEAHANRRDAKATGRRADQRNLEEEREFTKQVGYLSAAALKVTFPFFLTQGKVEGRFYQKLSDL